MSLHTLTLTPAGSAGSATASATTEITVRGYLDVIKLDYTSQPETTDVTVVEASGLQRTFASVADANSDTTLYPAQQLADSTDQYERYFVDNVRLTVTLAQGDPVANGLIVQIQIIDA